MDFPIHVAIVRAPDSNGTAPRKEQRIAGTGATEAANAVALTPGQMATVKIGKVAMRLAFRNTGGLSGVVSNANTIWQPGDIWHWEVTATDCFVYGEAEDGTSAYEAHVWQSS